MATFWERAANSVFQSYFPCLCIFVVLVVSHLGFEDENLVLIALVPGHCFPFTFHTITQTCPCNIQQYFTAGKMIIFR